MAPPTEEQLQRWTAKLAHLPGPKVFGVMDQVKSLLGDEYEAYFNWEVEKGDERRAARREDVTPAMFAQALRKLDYNSDQALIDFREFLNRPNFIPIVIGYVGQTLIQLIPEGLPYQLEPHNEIEGLDTEIDVNRPTVSMPILGLWQNPTDHRAGHHSDEGYASENSTPVHAHASSASNHPLEVFQQLGLLYEKKRDSEDEFQGSNYVLVTSVYDDSIWVLWRKYIQNQNTLDWELAKDVWYDGYDYGIFPGMPSGQGEHETIIYAKIADNWGSLQPTRQLQFSRPYRAPSSRNNWNPEPLLTPAMRTAQGGIRRENDFRTMLPRPSR